MKAHKFILNIHKTLIATSKQSKDKKSQKHTLALKLRLIAKPLAKRERSVSVLSLSVKPIVIYLAQ